MLTSVVRIAGGVAVICATLVAGWAVIGFFVGIAIRAAQLVLG